MTIIRIFTAYFILLLSIIFCYQVHAQPVKIIIGSGYRGVVFGSHSDDSYSHNSYNNFESVEYSEEDYYPVVYELQLNGSTSYFYGSVPASAYSSLPVFYPVSAYYPANANSRVPTIVVGIPSIGNLLIKPVNRTNYPATQSQGIQIQVSSPRR